MIREQSFGVVPVYKSLVLLVQHGKGHWALPKGHAEKGESPKDTARRELAEETGITEVEIDPKAKFKEQYFFRQKGGLVNKKVTYFLSRVKNKHVTIQPKEIGDYKWLSFEDAIQQATFPETKKILQAAKDRLAKSN